MTKITQLTKNVSIVALVLAFWYVYSVISNARDLIQHGVKNAPASYVLILTLSLIAYTWYANHKKFNTLNIITLSVLATSIVIWAGGLSTRAIQ